MRSVLRVLAVTALAAGALVVPATTAPAQSAPPVISVVSTSSGITYSGPTTRRAGRVTFRFVNRSTATDPNAQAADVVLVKLRRGVSLATFFAEVRAQSGGAEGTPTPAQLRVAAASTRAITRDAHLFGGAVLERPGQTADVTQTLYRGTYYLVDIDAVFAGAAAPSVRRLEVVGTPERRAFPRTSNVITTTSADRFVTSPTLQAGGSYLIRNTSDTLHFVSFARVAPGTTDAQVAAAFRSDAEPTFFLPGGGVSHGVLSPGTQTVFRSSSLTPGTYVLLCFVADAEMGMPHAFMGMHEVVTVR